MARTHGPAEYPAYGYCTDQPEVRRLVLVLRRLGNGKWRGHRWLDGRWSALASFTEVSGWLPEGVGERLTNGADWRDFSSEVIIDGVVPTAGMLLVSHSRRRVYGVVVKATREGKLRWRGSFGSEIESPVESLINVGASYEATAPAGYEVMAVV